MTGKEDPSPDCRIFLAGFRNRLLYQRAGGFLSIVHYKQNFRVTRIGAMKSGP